MKIGKLPVAYLEKLSVIHLKGNNILQSKTYQT